MTMVGSKKVWDGTAGWAHYSMICFYCKAAVFAALPTKCWCCGCTLSEQVTPKMKIRKLSDLCVNNGKRLVFDVLPTA